MEVVMKKKWMSWIMMFAFMGMTTLPVQAAMMSTEQMVQIQQGQMDREQVAEILDRAEVQEQLVALGVSPDDVKERVAVMTDAEVAELNQHLADLPAGGSVVGLIVLIFIVFVVTDVLGATDIFPFIKPIR
jgi:hypothetical protein